MKKITILLLIFAPLFSSAQWFSVTGRDNRIYTVYGKASIDSIVKKITDRLILVEKEDTLEFSSKYFSLSKGYVDFKTDSLPKSTTAGISKALSDSVKDIKNSLDSLVTVDKIEKQGINSLIRTGQEAIGTILSAIEILKNDKNTDKAEIAAIKEYLDKLKSFTISLPQ